MKTLKPLLVCIFLLLVLAFEVPAPARKKSLRIAPATPAPTQLSISPAAQETPEWCWVAVGQMIFQHFNIRAMNPDYQCGIIAFWGAVPTPYGWQGPCMASCYRCPLPAGSFSTIQAMLDQYPRITGDRPLRFRSSGSAITPEAIKDEIDNERPILIGITPSGARLPVSQHVALIIGYEAEDDGFNVIVNDPFPYRSFGIDPFVPAGGEMQRPGQYRIAYNSLRTRLLWRETIYGFEQR
jgi:hypothetical protein